MNFEHTKISDTYLLRLLKEIARQNLFSINKERKHPTHASHHVMRDVYPRKRSIFFPDVY